jgi:hypothetical protein
MRILIDKQEVMVASGSFSRSRSIENQSTCRFIVKQFTPPFVLYKDGQTVEVYDNGGKIIYSGVVFGAGAGQLSQLGYIEQEITTQGTEYVTINRRIPKAFSNTNAYEIAHYIYDKFLKPEGIMLGGISNFENINSIVFNYITVNEALNKLAERSRGVWYITPDKYFYFKLVGEEVAPFPCTWDVILRGTERVDKTQPLYRNTQYVLGSRGQTDERIEVFNVKGEKNFIVSLPIAKKPVIEISLGGGAFTPASVGVNGLDKEGYQFYWQYDSNTISYDQNADPLTDQDFVRITYKGLYPIVVKLEDPDEVIKRAALTRTTGIVEAVEEAQLDSFDDAYYLGKVKLNKLKVEGNELSYDTDLSGLEPGMIQPVYLEEYGIINDVYLITEVAAKEVNDELIYTIKCVKGPTNETWTKFFVKDKKEKAMIEGSMAESGTVLSTYTFSKTWVEQEVPNLFGKQLYPGSNTFPGPTTFPGIDPKQKITYLAWERDGVELGRIAITSQTVNNGEVFSIGVIPAEHNNSPVEGLITHLSWWGGGASKTSLSGSCFDRQPFNIEKSSLDIFQIQKSDLKGW